MAPDTGEFCIGLGEPVFLASIAAGVSGAALLGAWLARRERRVALPRQARNVIWLAALAASAAGPLWLLTGLFAWRYPQLALCTTVVGPWFAAPPVSLFAGALAAQLFAPPKQ